MPMFAPFTIGLFALAFAIAPSRANAATMTYETELCQCKIEFDSAKIQRDRIENALGFQGKTASPTGPLWTNYYTMSKDTLISSRKKLETDLDSLIKNTQELSLPDLPAWEKVRAARLRELRLERQIELASLDFLANGRVEPLEVPFEGKTLPKKCLEVANALKTQPSTLSYWETFAKNSCQKNGYPAECLARLHVDKKAPNALRRAQVQLLFFGWNNCVNETFRVSDDIQEPAIAALKKLFKKETCECNEP